MRLLARIAGIAHTPLNAPRPSQPPSILMQQALHAALADARMSLRDVDGLIAVPSLAAPHFMEAHFVATQVGLLPSRNVLVRTIDTGGAGPISAVLEAKRMITVEGRQVVAVVAGDAVASMPRDQFLERADATCRAPQSPLPSPHIPNAYDMVARWHMERYGVRRETLAKCASLMTLQASRHPEALTRVPKDVYAILSSPSVAPATTIAECARRADGGAAIIVASSSFLESRPELGDAHGRSVVIIGGGEGSGPLYPPPSTNEINEEMFSCEDACRLAYDEAQLGVDDIDFFGLYDCFPICLLRAIEAVGLAEKGRGGDYIDSVYEVLRTQIENPQIESPLSQGADRAKKLKPQQVFPVNTHGGLMAFGAPWEVPAMYNVIEAVRQLRHEAGYRQVDHAKRALVYGNGGIFSASSVAILGSGKY